MKAIKLFALVLFIAVALVGCTVEKTQEGKLPEVDVDVDAKAGQLPKYDVDAPDVDVSMEEKTIKVPDVDVDVSTEEKTIKVPDIDVDMPEDHETDDEGDSR